jgi:hypothetical protein
MNRTSTEKLAQVKPGPFFDQAQVAGLGGIRATRRDPEMRRRALRRADLSSKIGFGTISVPASLPYTLSLLLPSS